ncbi:MAG: spermidine/putrescine ABC transporter substrate-binding protein [Tatlockia sp.]|jgi:spermidine/putrescine transport system substrate-binding protein
MKALCIVFFLVLSSASFAGKVVNVYIWGGEIPKKLLHRFEQETGITVRVSTYDNNETMYAKLKASRKSIYDVVLPSGYFVERMRDQGMLTKLNAQKLPNLVNLGKHFTTSSFDPGNQYSVPLVFGATGIFYNESVNPSPQKWQDLWQKKWRNQLMLLDDSREVFSIALLSLGFDPNDKDPVHIEKAYKHLLALVPNIKLFASDSIQAIMIDEDAKAGVAWNGDAFKAQMENSSIRFDYPKEGFMLWVDCLAIPKNPPHLEEAYRFIDYLLKPESGLSIALTEGAAITNEKARALLPETIRNNPMVYPPSEILERGHLQRDVGEETLALYNKYWQQLKMAF